MKNTEKLVKILLKNGTEVYVYIIKESLKWTLCYHLTHDYFMDGQILINNKYIKKIIFEDSHLFFKHKILKLKKIDFSYTLEIDLNNTDILIKYLIMDNQLLSIELLNNEFNYVGCINILREKSMRVQLIDKECNWLNIETFRFDEIRAIYFNNDYLNSLQLYLESEKNM